jgi:hypothetical protein
MSCVSQWLENHFLPARYIGPFRPLEPLSPINRSNETAWPSPAPSGRAAIVNLRKREKPSPTGLLSFSASPRQVGVDPGSYVAHPALEPEIEQKPAKRVRGVFPNVEGVTTGSFRLCLLAPKRPIGWLGG